MELFSSQSCPNCPEANRNLINLAKDDDSLLVLTYPVGYWDYLGWHDTHAKPEFAELQKQYNRSLGHRGPYTPQVVFDGIEHCSGSKMKSVKEAMSRAKPGAKSAQVSFTGGGVEVSGSTTQPARVRVVHYIAGVTEVTPGGGANHGKPMGHLNLVTHIETLGSWTGGDERFAVKCPDACAVLVQTGDVGRVIGAAANR